MIDPNDPKMMALPEVPMAPAAVGAPADVPLWFHLLKMAASNAKKADVAKAMDKANGNTGGCSRPYISRVLSGDIPINKVAAPFIHRVLVTYIRVQCPHLDRNLSFQECADFAAIKWAKVQGSGPEKTLHWRACQRCPHRPEQPAEEPAP